MKKKICIIAVNHKNSKLCYDMYNSVIMPAGFEFEFIVADNSLDVIEATSLCDFKDKNINFKLLLLEKNLGYFSAINEALASINIQNYCFIIVANNDIIFHPHFFQNLVAKTYGENVYVICPDVVKPNGDHQNPHVLKKFNFFQRLRLDLYYSNYYVAILLVALRDLINPVRIRVKYEGITEMHMGIGAIYILTSAFFFKNVNLNFPLFLYGEEAFLSRQVHDTGGVLLYDPTLIVNHLESASLSKIQSKFKYMLSKKSYKIHRSYL